MTPRFCIACGTALQPDGLCAKCLLMQVARTPVPKPPRLLPSREELATLFPGYAIGELLGQGGMGIVYAAEQKELARPVALKLLAPEIAEQPDFEERFRREARVLASLKHPGIVTVYDCGRAGPWFYFAMEKVEGTNLRQLIREKALSSRESLAIVTQICEALQYAHERGVVHRDIKPENMLVDRSGRVRVLDFGLSKVPKSEQLGALTRTDQVMGTPHYMAPEQWERPAEVDHRADIYALGVVFYELLTGELPLGRFEAPSHKVEVDVRLDEIVLRSLAKNPGLRYQQAVEIQTDVQRVQSSVSAPPAASRASIGPSASSMSAQQTKAQQLVRRLGRESTPHSAEAPRFPRILIVIIVLGLLSTIASVLFPFSLL
jgi:serine/threonine protein kinase